MKVLLQRVSRASVTIDGDTAGSIATGLTLFLCVEQDDTEQDADYLKEKCLKLRIFPDEEGRFDRSVLDVGGGLLIISQFTLAADTRKGRRPSFTRAAPPEIAEPMVEYFITACRASGLRVETGKFGAYMQVALCNDGPVTIWLDSRDRLAPRRNS